MCSSTCRLDTVRKLGLAPALVATCASFVLIGCSRSSDVISSPTATSSPSPQPSPSDETTPGRAVTFRASDGVRIAGRLFGDGPIGVVLGHQIDNDQTAWWDFAERLATDGYVALTINFRGYCPEEGADCSGDGGTAEAWRDLVAASEELHNRGARRVVVIGASMGGTAAVVAASEARSAVDGLITLSAPADCCGMVVDRSAIQAADVPMLFIAGRFDGDAPSSARRLGRFAGSHGEIVILASGEHGTDLIGGLATPQVERRTTDLILDFLDRVTR
jgi:pimeloyl-ACP methyl ester carboxylesterase